MKTHLTAAGAVILCLSCFSLAVGQLTPRIPGQTRPPVVRPPAGPPTAIQTASEGWKPCKDTAAKLAIEMDNGISSLKNEGAQINVSYMSKEGRGLSQRVTQIKNSKVFHLEYPQMKLGKLQKENQEILTSPIIAIADGSNLALMNLGERASKVQPLATAKLEATVSLSQWPVAFPRLIFSPLRGGKPFSALIASVRAAGSAFKTVVEERKFDYQGAVVHQKRVTISKSGAGASPLAIQIVMDAGRYLPVKIVSRSGDPKAGTRDVFWAAHWVRVPKNDFNHDAFKIPPAAKKM